MVRQGQGLAKHTTLHFVHRGRFVHGTTKLAVATDTVAAAGQDGGAVGVFDDCLSGIERGKNQRLQLFIKFIF